MDWNKVAEFLEKGNDGKPYSERMQTDFKRAFSKLQDYETKPIVEVTQVIPVKEQLVESTETMNLLLSDTLRSGITQINGKHVYNTNPALYVIDREPIKFKDFFSLKEKMQSIELSGLPLLIEGDAGIGKTQFIHTHCHETKTPLVTLMCSSGTKLSDIKGHRELDGNITPYLLGALPTAIEIANKTGKCLLYIDEIALLQPDIQGMINQLLDFRRSITIESLGITYSLNKDAKLIIVATTNPVTYGGRNHINKDLNGRFISCVLRMPTSSMVSTIVDWMGVDQIIQTAMIQTYEQLVSLGVTKKVDYIFNPRDMVNLMAQYKAERMVYKETNVVITEETAFKNWVRYVYSKYRSEPSTHQVAVAKILRSCTSVIIDGDDDE